MATCKVNRISKVCPKCKLNKVLSEYYINKKTGRVYSYCKLCDNEKSVSRIKLDQKKDYYQRNKDYCKERAKLWVQNNRKKHYKYVSLYKLRIKGAYE